MNAKHKLYTLKTLFFGLILACTMSCDKDDQAEPLPTISDFVGSWSATSAEHTNNADANEAFDIIENGGEVRITVLQHGGVRTWVELGTFSDEWDSQLTITGPNTLRAVPVESTREPSDLTFTLDSDVLTLTNTSALFDFTLMGAPEVSTTLFMVFQRQ